MAFWRESGNAPKRKFRFKVIFGHGDITSNAPGKPEAYWWAKTVKIPSFNIANAEHDYLDNKYNFPGRVTWEDVTMNLVDPSTPDAVDELMAILQQSGYLVKSDSQYATIGKTKASNLNVSITVLDANGGEIEAWTLNNAYLASVDLGEFDYSSDELRDINLTIKYDWAVCNVNNSEYNGTSTNGSSGGQTGAGPEFPEI